MTIRARIAAYFFAGLCLFSAGFLLHFGQEARNSGSWKYAITQYDEFSYWAYAKGAAETPVSDGNPFYFEERGVTHSIPFTTAVLTGKLAKALNLPVMFFFPIWHIGLPFILWASLFVCLWKLWGMPPRTGAATAMLILLSPLFMHGLANFLLFRFSRPGDGLWLLFIWLSIIMNPTNLSLLSRTGLACLIIAAFWLHPFYALTGIWISSLEGLWQTLLRKNKDYYSLIKWCWLAFMIAALSYYWRMHCLAQGSSRLAEIISADKNTEGFHFLSIALYLAVTAMICLSKIKTKTPFSAVERLTLFIFTMEPLMANAHLILPSAYQLQTHRYYFLIIEMSCLTGFFVEKIRSWGASYKIEMPLAGGAFACVLWILGNPQTNFLLFLPADHGPFDMFDNSSLVLEMMPLIFLIVWLIMRVKIIKKFWDQSKIAPVILALFACMGFLYLPSQQSADNRNFPFDGVYRWLNQHAQKNEVVLTLSPSHWIQDYLILYTDQKAFNNIFYGSQLSVNSVQQNYRDGLHAALLLGTLDRYQPGGRPEPAKDKLHHLRLDYLLLNLPSPFLERITGQLDGLIREVYRDKRCVLWQVTD